MRSVTLAAPCVLFICSIAHADWTVDTVYRRVMAIHEGETSTLLSDATGCGEEIRLRVAPLPPLELVADQESCLTDTRIFLSTIAQARQDGDLARTAAWMDFTIAEPTPVRFEYFLQSEGVFRFEGPSHNITATNGNHPWGFETQILPAGQYHVSLDSTVTDGGRFVGAFDIQVFVIPEPSTWWLIVLAASCLLLFWRRRHRC